MTKILLTTFVFILANFNHSYAAQLFKTFDLKLMDEFKSYHVEDINNDGLKDIFLFLSRNKYANIEERWIAIFIQNKEGFSKIPSQSFKLLDNIIVFDIGDVSGDLKKEFVFITREGVNYYKYLENGFDLIAHKLFKTESIYMLPGKKHFQKWDFVADLNNDNIDEVFIPQITNCKIYYRNPLRNQWLVKQISLCAESKASGFYDYRFSVGNRAEVVYTTPYLAFEDFNADNRVDLIGVYQDSLKVFCQDEKGFFSVDCHPIININFGEIWRGAKIQRTHIGDKSERNFLKKITDLNQDGIVDIVGLHISTKKSFVNPHYELRIHFGRKDSTNAKTSIFFSPEPDQIINPGGTQLVLDILDLNKDKKLDLIMPIVKVNLKNIISMLLTKSVEIQAVVYLMNDAGFYTNKPDLKTQMVVKFTYRGGATSPVYEIADFNGDGLVDILSSIEEKMLLLYYGNEQKIIESKVGAKFNVQLPQDGELVRAMNLNADNKCDLIITYNEDNPKYKKLKNTLRVLMTN